MSSCTPNGFFDSAYGSVAPRDIGQPQPALVALFNEIEPLIGEAEQLAGADAACGWIDKGSSSAGPRSPLPLAGKARLIRSRPRDSKRRIELV
jgi:hypothetical protein